MQQPERIAATLATAYPALDAGVREHLNRVFVEAAPRRFTDESVAAFVSRLTPHATAVLRLQQAREAIEALPEDEAGCASDALELIDRADVLLGGWYAPTDAEIEARAEYGMRGERG